MSLYEKEAKEPKPLSECEPGELDARLDAALEAGDIDTLAMWP